jgi:hypothetical protein
MNQGPWSYHVNGARGRYARGVEPATTNQETGRPCGSAGSRRHRSENDSARACCERQQQLCGAAVRRRQRQHAGAVAARVRAKNRNRPTEGGREEIAEDKVVVRQSV